MYHRTNLSRGARHRTPIRHPLGTTFLGSSVVRASTYEDLTTYTDPALLCKTVPILAFSMLSGTVGDLLKGMMTSGMALG